MHILTIELRRNTWHWR